MKRKSDLTRMIIFLYEFDNEYMNDMRHFLFMFE